MADKRKKTTTIDTFFHKKPKNNEEDIVVVEQSKSVPSDANKESSEISQPSTYESADTNTISDLNMFDIGNFVERSMDRLEKVETFKKLWVPTSSFSFPVIKDSSGNNRRFRLAWLTEFNWLCYSKKRDGVFCKYCVFFGPKEAGINNQRLGTFCSKPYNLWRKAIENFRKHEELMYHRNAFLNANDIKRSVEGKNISVSIQLDQEKLNTIGRNRKLLVPIIEAILLCGRQELALRGHRDSGPMNLTNNTKDQGNFRAILAYRAKGDGELRAFLEGTERNKYLSPLVQNEVIDAAYTILIQDLVNRVNRAKAFTVLADETADICGTEQLTIALRYFDIEKNELLEEFAMFVPVTDLTGKGLATTLLTSLKNINVDCSYLRGQGYDGAAAMSGRLKGVQALINQTHPMAPYVHCMGHTFNLVVSDACSVPIIRNVLSTIESVRNFYISPKRKSVLNNCIDKTNLRAQSLKRVSQTRWIERFHAVEDFLELYDVVLESLEVIRLWDDKETARDAMAFLNSVMSAEFLIVAHVIAHIFAFGLPLSKLLQKKNIDLKSALNHADNLLGVLEIMRSNSESKFAEIFKLAEAKAQEHDISISVPRIAKRQQHRSNPQVNDVESYFRITVFLPFIDTFISMLKERFSSHRKLFTGFAALLEISGENFQNTDDLLEFYGDDPLLDCKTVVKAEMSLWHQSCGTKIYNSAIDAIENCDKDMFPNVLRLLQFMVTLPVSTATSERSFSTLKRIKTYLRNTIGQNRMTSLAMISVSDNRKIDVNRIIDILAEKKNRRMDIAL